MKALKLFNELSFAGPPQCVETRVSAEDETLPTYQRRAAKLTVRPRMMSPPARIYVSSDR